MNRVAMLFGVAAACCAAPGFALDVDPGSGSRTKAIAAASLASAPNALPAGNALGVSASSPFGVGTSPASGHNPLPDLPGALDADGRTLTGACASASDLCYDYTEKRLIYRPSRNWMPEIGGLKPEHMSVRKDSVVFRYSFK